MRGARGAPRTHRAPKQSKYSLYPIAVRASAGLRTSRTHTATGHSKTCRHYTLSVFLTTRKHCHAYCTRLLLCSTAVRALRRAHSYRTQQTRLVWYIVNATYRHHHWKLIWVSLFCPLFSIYMRAKHGHAHRTNNGGERPAPHRPWTEPEYMVPNVYCSSAL